MPPAKTIRTILIGTGGFARFSLREMLKNPQTEVIGLIEPSEAAREQTRDWVEKECSASECPPYFDSLQDLIEAGQAPDVAYIVTPHKFHIEHISMCLDAGIHVLVEKPMVLSQKEAEEVIAHRDRSGKLVVVGFPGSLSPAMTQAKKLIAEGKIGEVQAVSALVYQGWKKATVGKWRQDPEISGGGFLFDTGSHMINTVVDLIGSDISQVAALFDNREAPVEINSVISGVFTSGVQFTFTAVGDAFGCKGPIQVVGSRGILEIGMWGEFLNLRSADDPHKVADVYEGEPISTWQNFLEVYNGNKENPCPPEVGLRFAKLMDMIRESAESGTIVRRDPVPAEA